MKTVLAVVVIITCKIADKAVTGERKLRMEPKYNPFWVLEGTPFSATCIKEASSKMDLAWIVNGGEPSDSGFTVKNSTVRLDNGQIRSSSQMTKDVSVSEDFGPSSIVCETVVAEGREDRREELFVSVHMFSVFVEHPNISEGEDVSLKCSPDLQFAHVSWSRDGHVIDNTTERRVLEDNNRTLVLKNSRPQDSGVYQCIVRIGAGMDLQTKTPLEQSFTQNIHVSGKPYLRKPTPSQVDAVINGTLILTCPVAAFPAPEVYWLRGDDSPVLKSSRVTYEVHHDVMDATLKIASMTKQDLGVYECVAQNSVGRLVKEFRVGVAGASSLEHARSDLARAVLALCACLVVLGFDRL